MILQKIISGGQTGADQGALKAALSLGLKTGGWMPKGFRTEDGPRPDLAKRYGLVEHSSSTYPPRTLSNVMASDGTLIFGNPYSPGCRLTRRYTLNQTPCYMITWPDDLLTDECFFFRYWLVDFKIKVLNVAGNRESKNPGIGEAVRQFLVHNLTALREQEKGQRP